MSEEIKETFSNFDIIKAMEFLNLSHYNDWEIDYTPIQPSPFLQVGLKDAKHQVTLGANEWEQRLFMEFMFIEALRNGQLRMWQEKQLDGGKSPFRGKVDFAFTPYGIKFQTPYVVLSEAKKEDFDQGWGQCLMAMKTCQILNKKDRYKFDVYGIVSTGMFWEFGKFTSNNQFYKTSGYALTQPDILLGVLKHIFNLSEKNIKN